MSSIADLVLASPATIVDLAEVFGRSSHELWHLGRRQLDAGPSHAIRDREGALVVGGYVRDGDWLETWFWVHPRAGKRMLEIVRLVRLTLAEHGEDRIYAVVRSDAGRRIARALGYEPFSIVAGHEVWVHG